MLRGSDPDSRSAKLRFAFALMVAVVLGTGCASAPADFNSPEPAARNAAIVRAARDNDQKSIPDLIRMLESDDPTTRVLAIRALERLTGETRGYHPEADETARKQAVDAWTTWMEQSRSSGT